MNDIVLLLIVVCLALIFLLGIEMGKAIAGKEYELVLFWTLINIYVISILCTVVTNLQA